MKRLWEAPDRTVLMQALRDPSPRGMQPVHEALSGQRMPRCRWGLRHDWQDINVEGIARSGHVALREVACPTCGWAISVSDAGDARRWRLDREVRKRWRKRWREAR